MSGGVKVQISLTAAGDVEFNVLQRSALGGSKPLWRFQISQKTRGHFTRSSGRSSMGQRRQRTERGTRRNEWPRPACKPRPISAVSGRTNQRILRTANLGQVMAVFSTAD